MTFSTNRTSNLKLICNHKRLRTAKAILKEKNKARGVTIPDFRHYHKATVIKTAWYWHKNRHMDQWDRTESLEVNPHIEGQLTCSRGDKHAHQRKSSLFSKWFWESWTAACKLVKLERCLTLYARTDSKWLKHLNIRQDPRKLLEEDIGKTFSDRNRTSVFLGQFIKATETKAKINKGTQSDF